MFDFIRLACAVPDVEVGNTEFNTQEIIKYIDINKDADVIVFPELCVTGYTCADLFFQKTLIDGAKKGIAEIVRTTKDSDSVTPGRTLTSLFRPITNTTKSVGFHLRLI